jgi:NADH:ubiquinone oxidoreductase subunit 2 (subunit N)
LGYYLPVIAAMWMRPEIKGAPHPQAGPLPVIAGGSAELDPPLEQKTGSGIQGEVLLVAILAAGATIFFGIIPQPLFDLVHHAGSALSGLF